jgi:hypothetical protein
MKMYRANAVFLAACLVFSMLLVTIPVEAAETLTLTKPNGGENLIIGLPYTITWEGFPDTEFTLFLSTDSGKSYGSEIGKGKGGNFEWTVPNMPTTNARIKIWGTSSINWMGLPTFTEDASDADFSISGFQIMVLDPKALPPNLETAAPDLTTVDPSSLEPPAHDPAPAAPGTATVIQLYIDSVEYYVNGQLQTMDTPPVIHEGRTLLPIRYVAEPLGAAVGWEAGQRKATVTLGQQTVELWIGQNQARVNGTNQAIDDMNTGVVPLIMPPGRTMLPLRFIAETLGCQVEWDAATRRVTITYPVP